ncbi:MAG: site-specific integrase [Gemmatimonadetes bacterium]|nr:site-specific integrase [Gemmatimonadota bacterium]
MATTRLTKRSVDALPAPPECDYFVWDDTLKGFGVRVTEHAGIVRRAYVVGYRPASGQGFRRHTIGAHGPLTLQEARRRAKRLLADVLEGTDPAETRRQARARRSVREVGEAYLREVGVRRKATTATEYGRLWALHVVPALGALAVGAATTADVRRLHRALHATPYQANRVLAMLGAFFSFAEDEGLRERHSNPAHAVKPYPEVPRERFLSAAEVARLGEVLTRAERHGLPAAGNKRRPPPAKKPQNRPKSADTPRRANPFAIAALRLLLLTGCREGEILSLRWAAVDVDRGFLRLADTKTGKSVRPLGAAAAQLLEALPRVHGSPFVFPGSKAGQHLKDLNRLWHAVRTAAELPDVRIHDLRHSFAAVSATGGDSLLVTRALLGHRNIATTARYAHLSDDPVKAAADRASASLAAWLGGKETPVTPLRKGKA